MEVTDDMELNTVFVPLSYLKCNRSREISSLPVCEFRFDGDFTGQCAEGRTGNAHTHTHTHTHTHACTHTHTHTQMHKIVCNVQTCKLMIVSIHVALKVN